MFSGSKNGSKDYTPEKKPLQQNAPASPFRTPKKHGSDSAYGDSPSQLKTVPTTPGLRAEQGYTALISAAEDGDLEACSTLIQLNKQCVNEVALCGYTALMAAVQFNHKDICELLLEQGAQVNAVATGDEWQSALHVAAMFGYETTAYLLLTFYADATLVDVSRCQPWQSAEQYGHQELSGLLKAHASINNSSKAPAPASSSSLGDYPAKYVAGKAAAYDNSQPAGQSSNSPR